MLGKAVGLGDKALKSLAFCAGAHDVGKGKVSPEILNKPGALTFDEFELVKRHTWLGAGMLAGVSGGYMPWLVALTHHEKWDGSGYPLGLKALEIPLFTRIVTLADVFDALVSERSYKPAYSLKKTMDIIRIGRARHFDPRLVDKLVELADDQGAFPLLTESVQ